MSRYLKTSVVHSCFSQDLNERKPKRCKCRKFVSQETAHKLVTNGTADWLVDYTTDPPALTWHVVLTNRAKKTPRSKTIEKADIERYIEREVIEADKKWLLGDKYQEDLAEVMQLFNVYHDIEIEERLKLFNSSISPELIQLKKHSDNCRELTGDSGKVLADKVHEESDKLKSTVIIDDPWAGRAIFISIGGTDQRTKHGLGKYVEMGKERLDK